MLGVKDIFLSLEKFKLDNRTQIRFWEDKWLGSQALKIQYPNLFNIVRKKQATVADVLNSTPLNVSFRRALFGNKLLEWQSRVARVAFINLNEGRDTFIWNLNNNVLFSVKSMFKYLVNNGIKVTQEIWHMKVPLKIKIFLWFLKKRVILTKDNLAKRNWNGSKACYFCSTPKTIQHLFFIAIMPVFFAVLCLFCLALILQGT